MPCLDLGFGQRLWRFSGPPEAWRPAPPGHFYKAAKDGPPPGRQYAAIGYGLFGPLALEREPGGTP